MQLDGPMLAKAASAALMVFGRHHPLTQALHMAMADPSDLAQVHEALADLTPEHRRLFATTLNLELVPRQ